MEDTRDDDDDVRDDARATTRDRTLARVIATLKRCGDDIRPCAIVATERGLAEPITVEMMMMSSSWPCSTP